MSKSVCVQSPRNFYVVQSDYQARERRERERERERERDEICVINGKYKEISWRVRRRRRKRKVTSRSTE